MVIPPHCPQCGQPVAPDVGRCPLCGAEIRRTRTLRIQRGDLKCGVGCSLIIALLIALPAGLLFNADGYETACVAALVVILFVHVLGRFVRWRSGVKKPKS